MPSYDYRCKRCDHVFEVFQRITAEPKATCPTCESEQTQRLISGGTFHLRGSGWYASDYGGKGRTGTHGSASSKKDAAGTAAPSAEACPPAGCGACAEPAQA